MGRWCFCRTGHLLPYYPYRLKSQPSLRKEVRPIENKKAFIEYLKTLETTEELLTACGFQKVDGGYLLDDGTFLTDLEWEVMCLSTDELVKRTGWSVYRAFGFSAWGVL